MRSSIHSQIEDRYFDILDRYATELGQEESLSKFNQNNPTYIHVFKGIDKSISRAHALFLCAKALILKFRVLDGILFLVFGKPLNRGI